MPWQFALLYRLAGLPPDAQLAVVRLLWVVAVSSVLAWFLGLFVGLGFASPFARAADLGQLQQTVNLSLTLNLAQEIREQVQVRCRLEDPGARGAITRYIEALQQQYAALTKQRYPEPDCDGKPKEPAR